MHELSICQQLVKQVEDIALQNQSFEIKKINLQIGPLSGVEASLLQHAFPFAAEHTLAKQAELIIEEVPIVVQCDQCGLKTHAQINNLTCSHCDNEKTHLISGDEMLLLSVELNTLQSRNDGNVMELNHV